MRGHGVGGGQRTVQGNILVLLADTKTYSLLPTKAPPQIPNPVPRASESVLHAVGGSLTSREPGLQAQPHSEMLPSRHSYVTTKNKN